MITNKDVEKYFGNLMITYVGEITESIKIENKYLMEMYTSLKDKEIQEYEMVTCGFIHRSSLKWYLPFWSKLLEDDTNNEIIWLTGSYKEKRTKDNLQLWLIHNTWRKGYNYQPPCGEKNLNPRVIYPEVATIFWEEELDWIQY